MADVPRPSWLSRALLTGDARKLLVTTFISSLGYGQLMAVGVIYFTRFVRLTPIEVGLGMSISLIVGTAAGVPFGRWADRHGPRQVYVIAMVAQGVAGVALAFASSFGLFLLLLTLYRIADYGVAAARNTVIGMLAVGSRASVVRAYLRSASNLGILLGLPVAGLALQLNSALAGRLVLLANGGFVLAAALFAARLRIGQQRALAPTATRSTRGPLRDLSYLALTALSGLLFLLGPLLEVAVPLWIVTRLTVSPAALTVLYFQNTVLVVLAQPSISRRVAQVRHAVPVQMIGGLCVCLACLVWGGAAEVSGPLVFVALVLGGLAHTVGELFIAASNWTLAFDLAPADQQGEYGAVSSWGLSLALLLGPSVSAAAVGVGPIGWVGLAVLFAVAGALTPVLVGWRLRTHPQFRPTAAALSGSAS